MKKKILITILLLSFAQIKPNTANTAIDTEKEIAKLNEKIAKIDEKIDNIYKLIENFYDMLEITKDKVFYPGKGREMLHEKEYSIKLLEKNKLLQEKQNIGKK